MKHDPLKESAPSATAAGMSGSTPSTPAERQFATHSEWGSLVPVEQWRVYLEAIQAVRAAGIPGLLGGAFGLASYTGHWRNTKDLDLFILPTLREKAISALSSVGFSDYFATLAYDRGWIYRATKDGIIVDLIWGTPNRRSEVDSSWFDHAPKVSLRGESMLAIPPEELACIKLYVLQKDRCDWPDIINLLYATSASLDWDRLIQLVGSDLPLLLGLSHVFCWLCPDRISSVPASLLPPEAKAAAARASDADRQRVGLLDSRPWFAAFQPADRPMQL